MTAALTAVALTAGCGLTATPPTEPSPGHLTVGDKTRQTQSVKCNQIERTLQINASADPGRARVLLQLGGERPIVQTVSIENIDGHNGIAGGDVGKVEASVNGSSVYTITGTAVVSDAARPGLTMNVPFEIEAPC